MPPEALDGVRSIMNLIRQDQAYFVGSGGAIALAELAALTHSTTTAQPATAVTPLGLIGLAQVNALHSASVIIFSARARHLDVEIAARTARECPETQVFLVTQLPLSDIKPRLRNAAHEIVTLPPTTPDGFLATNSILAMGTAWALAAEITTPPTLPWLHEARSAYWPKAADRAVVLYGPSQRAAAFDLEARLSETGLADVQLSDYRNVAHGRHVGLARHLEETLLIRLVSPDTEDLAERTAMLLPKVPMSLVLKTPLFGVAGAIDLLCASMRLVGTLAQSTMTDPGRPKVSMEGRRLYHLSWNDRRPDHASRSLTQKMLEAKSLPNSLTERQHWQGRHSAFLARITKVSIAGIVLDYDGTCVSTRARTSSPILEIQTEIIRLLRLGIPIGIATGRGPSVADAFRAWLPSDLHDRLTLGLYNGGWIDRLSANFVRQDGCAGPLEQAAVAIEEVTSARGWQVTRRPWQVTVESAQSTGPTVQAILGRLPDIAVRVLASGHSVDIIPITSSKINVARALGCDHAKVMSVGDQGQYGGNDFDLLSSHGVTLSVDRVSADPDRCWNLSEDGIQGPELLVRYLRSVDIRAGGVQFNWPTRGRIENQHRKPTAPRITGVGSGD